jgi:hypothetical protein
MTAATANLTLGAAGMVLAVLAVLVLVALLEALAAVAHARRERRGRPHGRAPGPGEVALIAAVLVTLLTVAGTLVASALPERTTTTVIPAPPSLEAPR